jgi:hypothetical protein
MKMVVGVFQTQTKAREIIYRLQAEGFDPQSAAVITRATYTTENNGVPGENAPRHDPTIERTPGRLIDWLLTPGHSLGGVEQPIREPSLDDLREEEQKIRLSEKAENVRLPKTFHKTLGAWGLSEAEINDYERQVINGAVLVAIQAVNDGAVNHLQQLMKDDGAGSTAATSSH